MIEEKRLQMLELFELVQVGRRDVATGDAEVSEVWQRLEVLQPGVGGLRTGEVERRSGS